MPMTNAYVVTVCPTNPDRPPAEERVEWFEIHVQVIGHVDSAVAMIREMKAFSDPKYWRIEEVRRDPER